MANEQTPLLPQTKSPQIVSKRALPRTWGWKTLSITAFTILFFSAILALRSRRASVPDVVDHEFGVGFDLTSPYG